MPGPYFSPRTPMRNQILLCSLLAACATSAGNDTSHGSRLTSHEYFDNAGRDDVPSGGVKLIPISTPKGTFKVWTKRVMAQPTIKVLLLQRPGPSAVQSTSSRQTAGSPGPGSSTTTTTSSARTTATSRRIRRSGTFPLRRRSGAGSSGAQAHSTNFFLLGQSWAGGRPWSTRSNTSSISRGSSYRT